MTGGSNLTRLRIIATSIWPPKPDKIKNYCHKHLAAKPVSHLWQGNNSLDSYDNDCYQRSNNTNFSDTPSYMPLATQIKRQVILLMVSVVNRYSPVLLGVSGRARSRVVRFIYQGVVRVGVGVSLGLIYQQVS